MSIGTNMGSLGLSVGDVVQVKNDGMKRWQRGDVRCHLDMTVEVNGELIRTEHYMVKLKNGALANARPDQIKK